MTTDSLKRILVTNDDGIESPGLRRLAAALAARHDVIVVAPRHDVSGSGTGIGRLEPDSGVAMTSVDLDGVLAYEINGPPGLAVLAAALGAFGRAPDLVVSGINAGMNTGHSVIHSGTVGAALTARTFEYPGLAVSLARSEPWEWDTAVTVAVSAAQWLLDTNRCQVLNINVPGLPLESVRGIHWADLDEFGYFRVATAETDSERLQLEVGSPSSGSDPASDTSLCRDGFVTATPLATIQPAPYPDIPATDIWGG